MKTVGRKFLSWRLPCDTFFLLIRFCGELTWRVRKEPFMAALACVTCVTWGKVGTIFKTCFDVHGGNALHYEQGPVLSRLCRISCRKPRSPPRELTNFHFKLNKFDFLKKKNKKFFLWAGNKKGVVLLPFAVYVCTQM
jgi:hypothetical protein